MPAIKIDTFRKQVKINDRIIEFSSFQFCYYYYFVKRAQNSQPFIQVSGKVLPTEMADAILILHGQIFPEAGSYRKELVETKTIQGVMIWTPTAKAHFAKINKLISAAKYHITYEGKRGSRSYGIQCDPNDISIATTTVFPTFRKKVQVFTDSDTFDKVLRFMERHQYSQVVVKHNNKLRLITPESVLRWLQRETTRRRRIIDLSDVFLSDLSYENTDSYVTFFKENRTVDQARKEFFERFSSNAPRLSAIIITSNGTSTGTPLGIITPWDFIDKKYW